jgi:hypothetical protein
MPDVLDNTPWWLDNVTTKRGHAGLLVQGCEAYEQRQGDGPKHLEGGFYGLEHLGPHVWTCKARADGLYRAQCECTLGLRPRPLEGQHPMPHSKETHLCNGHLAMIRKRGSGVCPPCVHPPAELEIQQAMTFTRAAAQELIFARGATLADRALVQQKASAKLWDLQAQLDDLVLRGIVHRCRITLTEVS